MLNKAQDAFVRLVDNLIGTTLPPIRIETGHTLQAVQGAGIKAGAAADEAAKTLATIGVTAQGAEKAIASIGAAADEAKAILARLSAGAIVEASITNPEGKTYRVRVNLQEEGADDG